jgi:magnesium transporter
VVSAGSKACIVAYHIISRFLDAFVHLTVDYNSFQCDNIVGTQLEKDKTSFFPSSVLLPILGPGPYSASCLAYVLAPAQVSIAARPVHSHLYSTPTVRRPYNHAFCHSLPPHLYYHRRPVDRDLANDIGLAAMSFNEQDVSSVAGPAAMAKPSLNNPSSTPLSRAESSTNPNGDAKPKKKRHRAGKNRKKRRPSFVAESEVSEAVDSEARPSVADVRATQEASFYRLRQGNRSNTSLESEALLDHREQSTPTARRRSIQQSFTRPSLPFGRDKQRASQTSLPQSAGPKSRSHRAQGTAISEDDEDQDDDTNDRTPLLGNSFGRQRPQLSRDNSTQHYGSNGILKNRRSSAGSKASSKRSKKKIDIAMHHRERYDNDEDYDVNNPPSMPGSPKLGSLDDVMVADMAASHSDRGRDAIINIDFDGEQDARFESGSPDASRRRHTVADLAERDVCFPAHASDDDEEVDRRSHNSSRQRRRRRPKQWPDLDILEEWSREEKEERSQQEHIRAKKISEPVMVGGRLRPRKAVWHREEENAPFRFTYFNELFDETIHARTISDLCQDGGSFRELFIPDPVELSDESEEEEFDEEHHPMEKPSLVTMNARANGGSKASVAHSQSESAERQFGGPKKASTGTSTPSGPSQAPTPVPGKSQASKRYGARPTFWLDVLSPTEVEMKVLAKAFGIHQLTIEDILMDEPREKVELFQSYYFVNYRSFEQDKDNEDYMEPINMYVVVFRDGVITFHHSQTPHPANVRRRIRQLNDYMSPTADWVSYAIIDDVTDAFAPMVQHIEDEVDNIDDEILYMHQQSADDTPAKDSNKKSNEKSVATTQGDMGAAKSEGEKTAGDSGGDMLRRVGECRKKVMSLYRLLGNKADVIKGFAKRCNEHWEVAPRSEIGLYLGDIQDHIVTMTGNLSHYEKYANSRHPSNQSPKLTTPSQPPLPRPQQLPRPDQHPHERTRRANRRRPRQTHSPRNHRLAHEHRYRYVGHERLGAGPGVRGRPDLVLVHYCWSVRVWHHVLLHREEGVWYCMRRLCFLG